MLTTILLILAVIGGWSTTASAQYCPLKIGAWDEGPAADLRVVDDLVFFTSGTFLRVVDIRDPEAPRLVGETPLPISESQLRGRWIGLEVVGRHALVAAGSAGLLVFDISDPGRPRQVSRYATPGYALEMVTSATHTYLTVVNDGVHVLDVSDLPKIGLEGKIREPDARATVLAGDSVLVMSRRLDRYSLDGAERLARLTTLDAQQGLSADLVAAGSRVLVLSRAEDAAWPETSIQALSLSELETSPEQLDLSSCGRSVRRARYLSGHLLMTGWERGLCLIDITEPGAPRTIASYLLPVPESLVIRDHHLIVADQLEGLQIFDISTCADQPPRAAFEILEQGALVAGEQVRLAELSSGLATSFEWSLGDGTIASGPIVEHTYSRPGRYVVKLEVANSLGAATASQQIVVVQAPPGTEAP